MSAAGRQLGGLALASAGLPVFRVCCSVSWPWALAGGLGAALSLSALTAAANRRPKPPGPLLALPLAALAVAAAWASSRAFPETAGNLWAILLMLGLGGAAARGGPGVPARCAGVLLRVTGLLYGTVLLFSLPQLRPEWLAPAGTPTDGLRVWAALLLPGAVLCLRGEAESPARLPHWPWWSQALLAPAAAAVTGGILSPALAAERGAFLELARSVSVLGVIRRFEALVSGAELMSGFCLTALLLSAAAACLSGRAESASEARLKRTQKKFAKNEKKC